MNVILGQSHFIAFCEKDLTERKTMLRRFGYGQPLTSFRYENALLEG